MTVDGVRLAELVGAAVAVGLAVAVGRSVAVGAAVAVGLAVGLAVPVGLAVALVELVGVDVELEQPAMVRSPVPDMATAATIRQNVF